MATNRSGHKPGGGIASKQTVHMRAPKVEPRAHARNPAAVAQYGALVGDHVTNRDSTGYRGDPDFTRKGYSPPVGPTDNVAACGVGGGRTIYKTGSQDQYGSGGAQKPAGRDILSDYGPEKSGG